MNKIPAEFRELLPGINKEFDFTKIDLKNLIEIIYILMD